MEWLEQETQKNIETALKNWDCFNCSDFNDATTHHIGHNENDPTAFYLDKNRENSQTMQTNGKRSYSDFAYNTYGQAASAKKVRIIVEGKKVSVELRKS